MLNGCEIKPTLAQNKKIKASVSYQPPKHESHKAHANLISNTTLVLHFAVILSYREKSFITNVILWDIENDWII